ncbi:MAG: HisA/HisF-related TIM barrel protein [Acidimicrobiales bacterium]
MDLYPAIDVRGGRSVRLVQGDFGRERAYGDPLATASDLVSAGARHLHLVDLDGARTGRPANAAVVAAVAAMAAGHGVAVQVGGGIRDRAGAEALFEAGVTRVVLGTAALEGPELVAELARHHPGGVAVGLDHRSVAVGLDHRGLGRGGRREVAVRGWTEGSGLELSEAVRRFEGSGAAALVVTDIGRDGMLDGPDLQGLAAVLSATGIPVVASGGVASVADLAALAALERAGRRLSGAIVGLALRQGLMGVEEAMAACAASG